MPPKFWEGSFSFEPGEVVPEHIEEWPFEDRRDPGKWHLEGYDTFDGEAYPLVNNIDSVDVARFLLRARMRKLEETQPTSSSGGQDGIQDKACIISPARS